MENYMRKYLRAWSGTSKEIWTITIGSKLFSDGIKFFLKLRRHALFVVKFKHNVNVGNDLLFFLDFLIIYLIQMKYYQKNNIISVFSFIFEKILKGVLKNQIRGAFLYHFFCCSH